jgi:hypothetical protein
MDPYSCHCMHVSASLNHMSLQSVCRIRTSTRNELSGTDLLHHLPYTTSLVSQVYSYDDTYARLSPSA